MTDDIKDPFVFVYAHDCDGPNCKACVEKGRMINEAVARKLGYKGPEVFGGAGYVWRDVSGRPLPLPDYCHSIAAAFPIAVKECYVLVLDGGCSVYDDVYEMVRLAKADTASMAICKAFLNLR